MTVLSAQSIRAAGILHPCHERTEEHGLTYGLGPCGYDLRLDLGKEWLGRGINRPLPRGDEAFPSLQEEIYMRPQAFILAAAQERFTMPDEVMGRVCDKSTLARRGLSVFNTVIEPGWRGFLTLELVNHSNRVIRLVQGQAIAQVIFERLDGPTELSYNGKYQDQEAGPQGPRS